MPRMSKKRKQEWALFLNERNRITVGGLCRKCRNDCKPPAALIVPAEQVNGGGLAPSVAGSAGVSGTRRGGGG